MQIEIRNFDNPVSSAVLAMHDLEKIVDVIERSHPRIFIKERLNDRPMADLLLKQTNRLYTVLLRIEQRRGDYADA